MAVMAVMADKVLLAEPRGFCAGVEMAIKALTWMVRVFDGPIYCYHEIVHNASVVEAFEAAGVVFVDDVAEVPVGAPVMLSAHGSAPEVVAVAAERSAVMIDAVCPLVTKVHHEVKRMAREGFDIIYVGHEGHDEAVGTIAEAPQSVTLIDPDRGLGPFEPADPTRVALVAQTTLGQHEWWSVLEDARDRFPELWTARKSDLCYATTNRQAAVEVLAGRTDVVLVVGSENSSNTRALVRVAEATGGRAHRVDGPESIDPAWLDGASIVGVTAGASAPDSSVRRVIEAIDPRHGVEIVSVTREAEYFPPPPHLRSLIRTLQAVVEAGLTARAPGRPGPIDDDQRWDATAALGLLTRVTPDR
jgi:4-hydroxy-3-methylbut-2-enyl diphosphate reductase